MSNKNKIVFVMLLALCAIIYSCTKPAGEGGTSKIKGKIYVRDYNSNFTILQSSYYAMEQRVYIIYGNETYYGNDIRTSYDGSYEFPNLRQGMYQIFAYSKDSTLTIPGGLYPVIDTVQITEDYQTIELPTMILLN